MNRDELWDLIDSYALAVMANKPLTEIIIMIDDVFTELGVE